MQRAALCLWISAGLAAALTVVQLTGLLGAVDRVLVTATGILTAALLTLLAVKIGAGRGWARWLFVVVYLFGSFAFVASLVFAPHLFLSVPRLLQASSVVQFMLQTVALVLTFASTSRQWFKVKRVASAP